MALGWAAIALLALGAPARAQVVRDGSLGSGIIGSGLDSDGQFANYVITEQHGALSGANLFHSFSDFSIGAGEIAAFTLTDAIPIANILARVTGGDASDIRGTIRTTSDLDGAALFLLNPAGISFGDTAQLDVHGSFHASTADVLRFEDGSDFDALDTAPGALLSAAEPFAFGFTRPDPGLIAISRARDLGVPPGATLSLIGGFDSQFPNLGGVQIVSAAGFGENILAPNATVQIAAARPGIDIPLDLASLDVDTFAPGDLGNVVLQNYAQVDVSTPFGDSAPPAGAVVIRAEQFVMANSAFINARNSSGGDALGPVDIAATGGIEVGTNSQITTWSRGAGSSSEISLRAANVSVSGKGALNSAATGAGEAGAVRIDADEVAIEGGLVTSVSYGSGAGGAIAIDAGSVDLSAGGRVTSEAFSDGAGGAIDVRAQSLRISNAANDPQGTFISTNTLSTAGTAGDGGALTVDVGTLSLEDGGQLFARTAGAGNAGPLTVIAFDSARLSGVDGGGFPSGITSRALQSATGEGGPIEITTPVLELWNGAQIASDTFGAGPAGDLGIFASDRVSVEGGENGVSIISAGSFAQAGSPPDLGPGGILRIETGAFELHNGGQVSASTSGPNRAGEIIIDAAQVEISGAADPTGFNVSGVFSQSLTFGVPDGGDGGDISITAAGDAAVADGARISARSDGPGNAGDIFVDAGGSLLLTSGATVTSETSGGGAGGSITLSGSEVNLSRGARVTAASTSTEAGAGDGGSIAVRDTQRLSLGFGSSISAETSGTGQGGSIDLRAGNIELSRSEITARSTGTASGSGDAGDIFIQETGTFSLTSGSTVTAETHGTGAGGQIVIRDVDHVVLSDGSSITTRSTAEGGGDAGNIVIAAAGSFQALNSAVTTTAADAGGGRISIQAGELVYLLDSQLETTVQGEQAGEDAGDIDIPLRGDEGGEPLVLAAEAGGGLDPVVPEFVVINRSVIRANATATNAGNITIAGDEVLISSDSVIEATSEKGVSGEIQISSPDADVVSQVTPLPSSFVDPSDRLLPPCAARTQRTGSFVVQSYEAVSPPPDALLAPLDSDDSSGPQACPPEEGTR